MASNQQPTNNEIKSQLDMNLRWSDRLAIFITDTLGSLVFLSSCFIFFLVWISWNLNLFPGIKPIDRFPFPALEMGVSIFAIILSVSVLISQNRQGKLDKLRQQVEFEVNVRAETEITKILNMLHEMQKKMGIDSDDSELEQMKENIDLQQIHRQMDDTEDQSKIS